jgi:HSP20 family molecular chaperone IbpA
MNQQAVTTMPQAAERTRVRPHTDVYETSETIVLVADVPGADADSIELALQEDVLTLRATNRTSAPEGWQAHEPAPVLPDYERSFRLTADIAPDAIDASLQHGRLRVVLTKRRPSVSRIAVRAG